MINFIDEKGERHGVIAEITERKAVDGEKSLSGTVYFNDEVIHGIDRGWKIEFNNEFYVVTYALPVDNGKTVELEFDAVHEFFYDFSKSVVYSELNGSNTMKRYLDFIFDGSGYSYRLEVDVSAFEKESFGMENRLSLFNDIVKSTGVEFSVNGRVVRILKEVGTDLSTIVKKGFNMQEIKLEKNINDFVTYKKGYGTWFDDDDHSKGRLEVEYESPLASVYGRLHDAPIDDERFSIKSSLLARVKDDVESSYTVSVQLTMEDLNKAGYEYDQPHEGDYIMAINDDLGFKKRIRIVSYESFYDAKMQLVDHQVTCNSLGLVDKMDANSAGIRNTVNQALKEAQAAVSIANSAAVSADGKHMNYYGPTEPSLLGYKIRYGDMWYQTVGEETVMNYWNGAEWFPIFNTGKLTEISKEVTAAIAQADIDREATEQKFGQAVTDAKAYTDAEITKFDTKFDSETDAIRNEMVTGYANAVTAGKSYTDTKTAEFDTQLGIVKTDIANTVIKADSAVLKSDKAIEDVGFIKIDVTKIKSDTASALGTANTAKTNAQTAMTNAGTALTTAQTAISNSGTALTNAQTALNAYNNLEIGDRNLLVNSGSIVTNTSYAMQRYYFGGNPPKEGEKLTVAIKFLLGQDRTSLNLYTSDGYKFMASFNASEQDVNGIVVKTFTTSYFENRGLEQGFNYITIFQMPSGGTSNSKIEWVKLVRGEKTSKDWIAAPEDVQVQITDINGELARKVAQTTFDTLNGTVQSQSTKISQNQTAIGLKADKTVTDIINQTVAKHTTDIKATADGLAMKADKSLVDTVKGTVDTHTTQIKATSDGLALKAEKSLVDTINGTVNTHTSQIKATADGLGLKADKTLVDTVKGTVDQHTLDIAATNNGILLKADKSTVDTLKGTVDKHTLDISANATAIGLRLTSAQVETVLTGKKYVNETALNATSAGLTAQITQVNTDLGSAVDRVVTIEANINGINTTVAAKADKTQITQLSNQISTKVESATYSSKMTQLDSLINARVEKDNVITQINLSAETSTVLIQGKRIQLDGDVAMNAAFITRLDTQTLTAVTANIATIRASILTADVITSIHLKVDNAMMDKLTANTAVVNYLFTKTAFVDNLNTKTLAAVTANIATIRSQLLIANVVEATHLKSDAATITKLFATDANVNVLTAKAAFINSVKAIDIVADRITGGIFNAAKMTVIGLDASSITSGVLNSINITSTKITNNFDTALSGSRMTGSLVLEDSLKINYTITGNGQYGNLELSPMGIYSYSYAKNGNEAWHWTLDSSGYNISQGASNGFYGANSIEFKGEGNFPAKIEFNNTRVRAEMSSYNGVGLGSIVNGVYANRLAVGGGESGSVAPFVDVYAKLNMKQNRLENLNEIQMINAEGSISGSRIRNSSDNWLFVGGRWGTRIGHLSSDGDTLIELFRIAQSGENTSFQPLNMNGNAIKNQSDIRLKKNIVDTEIDGISLMEKQRFIEFEWDKSHPYNERKPEGRQFGLEAQYAGFMAEKDPESSYLSIDMNKQVNLNSLTIQQLIKRLKTAEEKIKQLESVA